jgi:hypothetical protein
MALQVIGAGFGRTGSYSLKLALEMLDLGPCYHMKEVTDHPESIPQWQAAADGKPVDWDTLFHGYKATVDWPGCSFWRELAEHYPEAKVVLSARDPDRWYDSVHNTIYAGDEVYSRLYPEWWKMVRTVIFENTFHGRFQDRAYAIEMYKRHCEEVQRGLPADRLLVHEIAEGWEPLCAFLQVAVPQEPFPRTNTTADFQARMAAASAAGGLDSNWTRDNV